MPTSLFFIAAPSLRGAALALFLLLLVVLQGCASYSERIHQAHQAAIRGEPHLAIDLINEELDVDSHRESPRSLSGSRALLLLERATLLQAAGQYRASALDMVVVDDRLEWVDLSSQSGAQILRYVYSDDAGTYRPPPHERLLLNILNMINFLADGDLGSARVEARRFHILQDYFLEEEIRSLLPQLLGLGNYLAGASFEASDDYSDAARFYARAYFAGTWPESSPDRLLDLIALTGYSGADLGAHTQAFQQLRNQALQRTRIDRRTYRQRYQQGDTLLVVQTGMVPYRRAERIPLDRALHYSSRSPYAGLYLTSQDHRSALNLYHSGALSWLNFPDLSYQGLPPRRTVRLQVGENSFSASATVALSPQVQQGWEVVAATAMAAAISRAILRAAAGASTRAVTDHIAREQGASPLAAGLLSWLLGLAVEGTMAATDTPDTRSWTSLPADIHLFRLQLPPGPATFTVHVDQRPDSRTISVSPERFQLLNFSRLR